jgi:quinone-modifying oxidoreductase, subunit QmoC
VLGAIAVGGTFQPPADPVLYGALLSHGAIGVLFGGASLFALAGIALSVRRAWRLYRRPGARRMDAKAWIAMLRRTATEVLSHRRFGGCDHGARRWAHLGIVTGFLGLFGLSAAMVLLILAGRPHPLPPLHGLKIAGNLFALALVGGSGWFLWARIRDARRGVPSTWFDWLPVLDVLLVGLTGIANEVLRYAVVPTLAYPVFVVHLVLVFVMIVLLPYTKLAHAVLRTVALLACADQESPEAGLAAPETVAARVAEGGR